MLFPDKVNSIAEGDKVLEVGPGGNPHPRANVLLEKIFDDEVIATAQRGYAPKPKTKKEIVYYSGPTFPFKDGEFDYVICSHVLEHIPFAELSNFIFELQRVAKAGYIEFPTIFYELINHQDVHLWYMYYRDETILFLDKSIFKSNYVHKVMREMFWGKDNYMANAFRRYRELFFCYLEWSNKINYRIVKNYDELITEQDFNKYKDYFKYYKKGSHLRFNLLEFLRNYINSIIIKLKNLFYQ
jgi:ubiquinone/menaquinone biosynthesis C-methylase UbiE